MTCPAPPGANVGAAAPHPRVLTRGDAGHDFIEELAPATGEPVIDKPGMSAFHATGAAGFCPSPMRTSR